MDELVQKMIETSSDAIADKVTSLVSASPEVLTDKLSKIVSCIDVSRIARTVGDIGSAESSLDQARRLAIELLGIEQD